MDAVHRQPDGVPLVGERWVVAQGVATEAEAVAAEVATAQGCSAGVDTEAEREVYLS